MPAVEFEPVGAPIMDAEVRSLSRLERLTDIIYGLSFLLILLQIDRPDLAVLLNNEAINRYLREQLPSLGIYFTSFVLVGCYWQSHLSMASRFSRSDTTHRWLQLGGLMGVALLPFVNDLLELMPLQASIGWFTALFWCRSGSLTCSPFCMDGVGPGFWLSLHPTSGDGICFWSSPLSLRSAC